MIYLDNAATSFPKAPEVAGTMARFLAEDAANPGRAGHRMAVRAEQMLDAVRLKLTRLVNGDDARRMVFTLNGTDALNMALKGVLASDGSEHVITTVLEHNSVSRPLQAMAAAGGLALTRVPCDGAGFVDPEDIRNAIRPDTRMIVMTHASNVLGSVQDAAGVGAVALEHDLLFCLDAAQTVGIVPIDVQAMHVDLLAFPGHKGLLGPTGTGALYVGPRCPEPFEAGADAAESAAAQSAAFDGIRLAARSAGGVAGKPPLRAWREGGTGGDSASPTQPALFPYFLEGGTPNTVGIAGLGAAVQYVLDRGIDALRAHENSLTQQILERLEDDPRIRVYGPRDLARRVGPLSINIGGYEAGDAASILDDSFDIATRAGLHCAPYCHRSLGTFPEGTVRISVGAFSTGDDVAALLDALEQMAAT